MWDSTDILKTLGILFIIVMAWYIVFIIFQENKRFLLSLTSSEDNNNSKIENVLKKFLPSVKEGMSDDQASEYEKKIKQAEDYSTFWLEAYYQIDNTGEADQSKLKPDLVLKRFEANLNFYKLLAGMIALEFEQVIGQINNPEKAPKLKEKTDILLNLIKCAKIGISFLKDSKEEVESSGSW